MRPFKFRASSLGRIMTDAQAIDPALLTEDLAVISRKTKKSDEEKAMLAPLKEQSLSAGAKTYLDTLAKEFVYSYERTISSKYLEKGLMVENDSIELYNSVFSHRWKRTLSAGITNGSQVNATLPRRARSSTSNRRGAWTRSRQRLCRRTTRTMNGRAARTCGFGKSQSSRWRGALWTHRPT